MTGLSARGSENAFRYNTVEFNIGAGVRLGGHTVDNVTYGVDNGVYYNTLIDNAEAGIKALVSRIAVRDLCTGKKRRGGVGESPWNAADSSPTPSLPRQTRVRPASPSRGIAVTRPLPPGDTLASPCRTQHPCPHARHLLLVREAPLISPFSSTSATIPPRKRRRAFSPVEPRLLTLGGTAHFAKPGARR